MSEDLIKPYVMLKVQCDPLENSQITPNTYPDFKLTVMAYISTFSIVTCSAEGIL